MALRARTRKRCPATRRTFPLKELEKDESVRREAGRRKAIRKVKPERNGRGEAGRRRGPATRRPVLRKHRDVGELPVRPTKMK